MRVEPRLIVLRIGCQLGGLDIQSKVAGFIYEHLDCALCLLWAVNVPYRGIQQGEQGASVKLQRFWLRSQTLVGGCEPRRLDVCGDGLTAPWGLRERSVPTTRVFPIV